MELGCSHTKNKRMRVKSGLIMHFPFSVFALKVVIWWVPYSDVVFKYQFLAASWVLGIDVQAEETSYALVNLIDIFCCS